MTDNDFQWGSLGREWWETTGAECRATPQQIKFACSRFQGASRVKSAELAGYSSPTREGLRVAGSRAEGTTAVDALLTMAAAASAGAVEGVPTSAALKRKIGKLAMGVDGSIALKAAELLMKIEQNDRTRGEHPDDDGFEDARIARSYLILPNGASMFMLFYPAHKRDLGIPPNYPLLHDVHTLLQREPFGPQIFDWASRNLSDVMREDLATKLANPKWQLEARQKVWKEIGIHLDDHGNFKQKDVA